MFRALVIQWARSRLQFPCIQQCSRRLARVAEGEGDIGRLECAEVCGSPALSVRQLLGHWCYGPRAQRARKSCSEQANEETGEQAREASEVCIWACSHHSQAYSGILQAVVE